mmetsp:Transcript_12187/g.51330  ORF Transcript_12187/g.51330 Transcript_12187/m.51330 type:complete len:210 (-) Transcript_12187:1015-1644(-)
MAHNSVIEVIDEPTRSIAPLSGAALICESNVRGLPIARTAALSNEPFRTCSVASPMQYTLCSTPECSTHSCTIAGGGTPSDERELRAVAPAGPDAGTSEIACAPGAPAATRGFTMHTCKPAPTTPAASAAAIAAAASTWTPEPAPSPTRARTWPHRGSRTPLGSALPLVPRASRSRSAARSSTTATRSRTSSCGARAASIASITSPRTA